MDVETIQYDWHDVMDVRPRTHIVDGINVPLCLHLMIRPFLRYEPEDTAATFETVLRRMSGGTRSVQILPYPTIQMKGTADCLNYEVWGTALDNHPNDRAPLWSVEEAVNHGCSTLRIPLVLDLAHDTNKREWDELAIVHQPSDRLLVKFRCLNVLVPVYWRHQDESKETLELCGIVFDRLVTQENRWVMTKMRWWSYEAEAPPRDTAMPLLQARKQYEQALLNCLAHKVDIDGGPRWYLHVDVQKAGLCNDQLREIGAYVRLSREMYFAQYNQSRDENVYTPGELNDSIRFVARWMSSMSRSAPRSLGEHLTVLEPRDAPTTFDTIDASQRQR